MVTARRRTPKVTAADVERKLLLQIEQLSIQSSRTASNVEHMQSVVDSTQYKLQEVLAREQLVLRNYGEFRIVLKDLIGAFEAAALKLEIASSYTQKEIASMSADEYRKKVLVPLGMGQRSRT